ncbi:MAG: phosphopentomutase [Clostridiales bacterium]|nr:phosphopentomutase [Clostridiales bacterium]
MKRVILIVLDSIGIGALPDADKYGDAGANTLNHIAQICGGINIPNLSGLGIGNIEGLDNIEKADEPTASFGRAKEMSSGKDTTTGHWEMMGLFLEKPFKTFHEGFPRDFIEAFSNKIGRKVIGNYPASGTEIIKELGKEHEETGAIIVYTSADSVFQIAAHEEVVPLEELYNICAVAREMLTGDLQVARVIARPFTGKEGNYTRTSNRRDFSISPFSDTVLDFIKDKELEVKAVGKIEDIFNKKGITEAVHTENNMDGVDKTLDYMEKNFEGLIFTNLVDFDSKYGHRRNPEGYKQAIEEFDDRLPEIIHALRDEDILIITADHGNDPTYIGTDHTREYIPVLVYGEYIKNGVDIGTLETFADIGATIADYLNAGMPEYGKSFLNKIL